jgi:hypothetical protein
VVGCGDLPSHVVVAIAKAQVWRRDVAREQCSAVGESKFSDHALSTRLELWLYEQPKGGIGRAVGKGTDEARAEKSRKSGDEDHGAGGVGNRSGEWEHDSHRLPAAPAGCKCSNRGRNRKPVYPNGPGTPAGGGVEAAVAVRER